MDRAGAHFFEVAFSLSEYANTGELQCQQPDSKSASTKPVSTDASQAYVRKANAEKGIRAVKAATDAQVSI